ncbi:MAG TPA: glycerate-2-kinase family protein, partial [Thermoplasmata archaeon]|nr:glycerate-2-kinase family protein [Thermoplasmata archaeon]
MTLASDALRIARRAIDAVEPGRAVRRQLRLVGDRLRVSGGNWLLPRGRSVHLVAFGKAAARMYGAAWGVLAPRVAGGIVVLRNHDAPPGPPAQVFYGEHPVPGRGSVRAGRAVVAYLRSIPRTQSVLFLISGGGSSLIELPAVGIRVSDVARTTKALLGSGAPIQAMNIVRRHVSQIKGGGLARFAGHCRFASMAISDVVGDAPEDIASGPTVADPSSFLDALGVIRRYHLEGRIPKSVLVHLKQGAAHESGGRISPPQGRFSIVARNA